MELRKPVTGVESLGGALLGVHRVGTIKLSSCDSPLTILVLSLRSCRDQTKEASHSSDFSKWDIIAAHQEAEVVLYDLQELNALLRGSFAPDEKLVHSIADKPYYQLNQNENQSLWHSLEYRLNVYTNYLEALSSAAQDLIRSIDLNSTNVRLH